MPGVCQHQSRTLLLAWLLCFCCLQAAEAPRSEYEVKAAMLYNFARFVEWPAQVLGSASDPLVVGVLGLDPFGAILDNTLKGVTVNGRHMVVRRFASVAELKVCHILFVSSSETKSLPAVTQMFERSAVLTVGDMERFARQGGMIGFILDGKKVRFEINLDAAESAGLKISSKLLQLATVTRNGG